MITKRKDKKGLVTVNCHKTIADSPPLSFSATFSQTGTRRVSILHYKSQKQPQISTKIKAN